MTARGSAREQPPMLQAAPEQRICRPSQPTSWQRQPAPDRRIFPDRPRARPNAERDLGSGVTWIRIADLVRIAWRSVAGVGTYRSAHSGCAAIWLVPAMRVVCEPVSRRGRPGGRVLPGGGVRWQLPLPGQAFYPVPVRHSRSVHHIDARGRCCPLGKAFTRRHWPGITR